MREKYAQYIINPERNSILLPCDEQAVYWKSFSDSKAHACDAEKRIDDSWCSKEFILEENACYLDMCQKYNYTPILIDESYEVDVDFSAKT